MHSTLMELAQCVLCALAFSIFLLPPGYLAAWLIDPKRMQQRSAAEQLLWSIALSLPIALVFAELLGRVLRPPTVIEIFVALELFALVWRAYVRKRDPIITPDDRRKTQFALLAAGLLAAYLILTLIDIQVGGKLFVPTTLTDWGVRVPLVGAAIRGGVPPLNPLSALGRAAPPLRYYYFWYVLCALPARMAQAQPVSALIASSVWAGFALLSITFLAMKYLVGMREHLRRRCLLVLLPMLVIGLDILPTLALYLSHSSHPELDIEWWHPDRTPGLLTALVYAPHHIAGLVCCFIAIIVLVVDDDSPAMTWGSTAKKALIAGIAFAACVGTSTFIAFIFVIACLLWSIDLVRTRQWMRIAALAGSGVVAYLLSRPFLHEMRSTSSAAQGFATFAWRSTAHLHQEFARRHILVGHPVEAFFAQQPLILLLDFSELGFFAFVALYQFRTDLLPALRGKRNLTIGQRALWAIFFGAAFAALFVSSSVTSSGNDLGGHAAMLVRFILVLWSVRYLEELWALRSTFSRIWWKHRLVPAFATTCLLLGLAGGLFDAVLHRVDIPLFDAGKIKRPIETLTSDHLGERFLAIRTTWRELDAKLPAAARVQFNPYSPMQPALARYTDRQIVAFDGGCGTAFGGDYDACAPVRAELRHLFDFESEDMIVNGVNIPARPESLATTADFLQTCRDLSLDAIVVESTDPVWNQPGSWVWTVTPVIAKPTIRAYVCPNSEGGV